MDDEPVWDAPRRALAAGIVLTVTTLAFEALGIATAMPVVVRELGGVELYGWAFSAALLSSIFGIVVAGPLVDRLGPARPFSVGMALFAAGLVVAGSAPAMPVVVAGRLVQGFGIGVVPPVLYATIGRAFPDRARARVFALMSTAWVLPGVVGPPVSAWVAETIGWRWVFLGLLPFVPLNLLLTLPRLHRLGPPPRREQTAATGQPRVAMAALAAVSTAGLLAALSTGVPRWMALSVFAAVPLVMGLRRILPPGTFLARPGLPAAVSTRVLHTFSYFGSQAFVPLVLAEVRNQRAGVAGVVLTAATLAWTAGAWVQDRVGHRVGRGKLVATGALAMLAGISSLFVVFSSAVTPWIAAVSWAVAGFGSGLAYGGVSLVVLAGARSGEEGSATSAVQLADSLGMLLGTGLGGAAVAVSEHAGVGVAPGIAVAFAITTTASVGCVAASRRLLRSPGASPAVRREVGSSALPS